MTTTTRSRPRSRLVGFLGMLLLSSVTMLWMLWRFPIGTSLVTIAVLSALGVSARLARSIDIEPGSELKSSEQGS